MTRSDLIERIAKRYPQLQLKDADLAVKVILEALADKLSNGERIEIRGFGSFALNHKPPRIGRNPKTGERVDVPEKYVPHFKAGKEMRDGVNKAVSLPPGFITMDAFLATLPYEEQKEIRRRGKLAAKELKKILATNKLKSG